MRTLFTQQARLRLNDLDNRWGLIEQSIFAHQFQYPIATDHYTGLKSQFLPDLAMPLALDCRGLNFPTDSLQ